MAVEVIVKIVIAGGSGQIGNILLREFQSKNYEVYILTRSADKKDNYLYWDGKTLGPWHKKIDGCDIIINLAGRNVNCRYSDQNLTDMLNSRIDSTKVISEAIAKAKNPPQLWLQMSTATIYAHSYEKPNDEETGIIGGHEPNVPSYWSFSIKIATQWEKTIFESNTPNTRKVALRSSIVMSPDKKGIFDTLLSLTKFGLGGPVDGGSQYISWIHEKDFVHAILFLISKKSISGVINICSPNPLPQKHFMSSLRAAWGISICFPLTKWMLEIGAFFLRTDSELLLKSRYVLPKRLIDNGFKFEFPK